MSLVAFDVERFFASASRSLRDAGSTLGMIENRDALAVVDRAVGEREVALRVGLAHRAGDLDLDVLVVGIDRVREARALRTAVDLIDRHAAEREAHLEAVGERDAAGDLEVLHLGEARHPVLEALAGARLLHRVLGELAERPTA